MICICRNYIYYIYILFIYIYYSFIYKFPLPQPQVNQAAIDSAWSFATSRPKSRGCADDSFKWRPPVLGKQASRPCNWAWMNGLLGMSYDKLVFTTCGWVVYIWVPSYHHWMQNDWKLRCSFFCWICFWILPKYTCFFLGTLLHTLLRHLTVLSSSTDLDLSTVGMLHRTK